MPRPIIMTGLMALMGGQKFDLRTKIGTLGGLWSSLGSRRFPVLLHVTGIGVKSRTVVYKN